MILFGGSTPTATGKFPEVNLTVPPRLSVIWIEIVTAIFQPRKLHKDHRKGVAAALLEHMLNVARQRDLTP